MQFVNTLLIKNVDFFCFRGYNSAITINIICGFINFMLKKFKPITQEKPILFNEDVYLIDDSGKVLCGRHKGDRIKNIFAHMDANELLFIRENMFFAGLKPLLLVQSSLGAIFIDDSLFGSYRLLIAIVPHFSRQEVLAMVSDKIKSIVLASPDMKDELAMASCVEFDQSHDEFCERLLSTHRGAYYYRVHGRMNGDISMMMSEIAYDFSRFCGCELELTTNGVGLFEMKNDLCIDSYVFALTSLLFTARNCSSTGKAKMDVYFDEMGIYFEFGFEIAEEYRSISLQNEVSELKNFKFRAENHLFNCDFYQNDRAFAVRAYPWFKHPNSADIKEKRKEFIYNM